MISLHISTCERLSVLHKQTRLPEIFDEILNNNTPVLEFGSKTPPSNWNWGGVFCFLILFSSFLIFFPESKFHLTQNTPCKKIENTNFLSRFQNWPYPEQNIPPPQLKTLIFFPESKTDLTKNTPPPNWKL